MPLLSHQQPVLPRKEGTIEQFGMTPFYLYGRLIAVLEQGGRGHDDIQWLEQYYPGGSYPQPAFESHPRDTGIQS